MKNIRLAQEKDVDLTWNIFSRVTESEDCFVYSRTINKSEFKKIWFADNMQNFIFEENGMILGAYFIKPNQIDLGSHIANAAYMVHPDAHRKGIGAKLCQHSLEQAKKSGYLAMQFNLVVSTNETAIALWKKFNFHIIGTVPNGFLHAKHGLVDAHIMYRVL